MVVVGVLLLLGIAVRATVLNDGTRSAASSIRVPIQYTVVAGDTARSSGSLLAVDPAGIMRQAGVNSLDTPLAPGQTVTVDAAGLWAAVHGGQPAASEALVERTARRFGVDPILAVAVAWQESRLQQSARSPTGAVGIMQIEPDTGRLASRDLGISIDPTVASDNVVAGIFWLHSLLLSYGGNRALALAAYYEGPGNLARRGYLVGTSEYVAHVQQVRYALLRAATRAGT